MDGFNEAGIQLTTQLNIGNHLANVAGLNKYRS